MQDYKAITIRDAWAWAIFNQDNPKDVENRKQNFYHRGQLLVHVSVTPACKKGATHLDTGRMVCEIPKFDPALRGHIIGVVTLKDVVTNSMSPWAMPGHHHLILSDPILLANPIECKGQLGLWTYHDYVGRIEPQVFDAKVKRLSRDYVIA